MLFFSKAKIRIFKDRDVIVEGLWKDYTPRIRHFFESNDIVGTIHHRFGRIVFSSSIDPRRHQRIRNFLINECSIQGKH